MKMEDFDQALIYMNEGKYEEAAKEFTEYINANEPDPIDYLNFGNLLLLLEQYEEAERILRKEHNDQALIYMNEGKYEEAAKEFIEYINANETDPIGYLTFGNLLVLLEQYEEAERIFRKAIDLDSELATGYYSLGNLFYE